MRKEISLQVLAVCNNGIFTVQYNTDTNTNTVHSVYLLDFTYKKKTNKTQTETEAETLH